MKLINEYKLTRKAKDFLKECRRMKFFNIKKIHVPPQIFSELLDGIAVSDRSECSEGIPYEGKLLVKK